MTRYTFANLDAWARKTQRRADLITKQATQDTIEMASRTAPGKNRGGTVTLGFVPRDTGVLAGSLQSSLNGSTALKGEDSYTMIVAGMEGGDTATFGWTAEYARAVHYRGWLWRDNAADKWPQTVARAIAKAKARTR